MTACLSCKSSRVMVKDGLCSECWLAFKCPRCGATEPSRSPVSAPNFVRGARDLVCVGCADESRWRDGFAAWDDEVGYDKDVVVKTEIWTGHDPNEPKAKPIQRMSKKQRRRARQGGAK